MIRQQNLGVDTDLRRGRRHGVAMKLNEGRKDSV